MKLFILGNGFDKNQGLPTTYKDFFSSDMINKKMEEMQKLEIPKNNFEANGTFLSDLLFDETTQNKYLDSNVILYFLYSRKNNNIKNWADVEFQIEELLFIIKRVYFRTGRLIYLEDVISFSRECGSEFGFEIKPESGEEHLQRFFQFFHLKMMLSAYLKKDYLGVKQEKITESEVYTFLFYELKKFEEMFREYLGAVQNAYIENLDADKMRKIIKFFTSSKNEKKYVLSFNYTTYLTNSALSTLFSGFHNIHGSLDEMNGSLIFGIDNAQMYNQNEDNIDVFIRDIFSKTARVFVEDRHLAEGLSSKILPDVESREETIEVIIFGHSLSKADYSYFQTIFDHYDLYSDETLMITYRYDNFENRNSLEVKMEKVRELNRLLESYGKTFNNKDHGRNLVHKLLLEQRVKVVDIGKTVDTHS